MRLTLRTMLAYLDDVLDPSEAQQIGKKISEVETASNLVLRIRDAVSRPSLGAPKIGGRAVDANTVAEYLDNTLPADRVVDFERICLMDENDVYLAEVASCHQILAEVLGDAADVDSKSRTRMYGLLAEYDAEVAEAKAQAAKSETAENGNASGKAAAAAAATAPEPAPTKKKREVPEYLREHDRGGGIWRAAAILLLGLLLAVVAVMAIGPQWLKDLFEERTQVADNSPPAVPADSSPATVTTPQATMPETPETPADQASGQADPAPTAPMPAGDAPATPPTTPAPAATTPADTPAPMTPPAGDAATPTPAPAAGTTPLPAAPATPDQPASATPPTQPPAAPANNVPPPQMAAGATTPAPDTPATPAPGTPTPLPPEPMPPASTAASPPADPPKVASVPATPAPAGTSPIPPATPAEEPAGERLGMLNSQQTLLFRQPPGAGEWQLVPVRGSAYVNDLLLSPPAYRNVLLLRDVALHLRGDTLVRLSKEDDLLKVLVYYGRIEILAHDADTQVVIKAGDQPPALVTFLNPASGLALECMPTREVGQNPEDNAPRYHVELFAPAGRFTWDAGEPDKVYELTAKSRYVLGTEYKQPLPDNLPEWITSDEGRLIIRQSAEDLSNELQRLPNISVLQRLEELAYDESAKVEMRSLARRSLVALDRYQPAVDALRKYDRVERSAQFWPDYIDSLRKAVQRNRQSAKGVRETLVKLEGDTEGLELYRMLWGYTPEQLAAGEGDRLLSYLTHRETIFRVLAEWNLNMILNGDPRTTVTFHENDPMRLKPQVDGFRRKLAQLIAQ